MRRQSATAVTQRLLLALLLALLAAIGAVLVSRTASRPPEATGSSQFAGPALPPGVHAASFSLADQHGRAVTLSRYRGQVVVLTFVHSLCHDACPFMIEQIKGALNDLPADGGGVPAIGVSVAPAEDTPASRRAFVRKHRMDGRMAFVGGTAAQLRPVWRAYAIQPVQGKVDHSTFVLLIDKRGMERVGVPADQLTPEGLAHDIRVLQRERA